MLTATHQIMKLHALLERKRNHRILATLTAWGQEDSVSHNRLHLDSGQKRRLKQVGGVNRTTYSPISHTKAYTKHAPVVT